MGQDSTDFILAPHETKKFVFKGDSTSHSRYFEITAQESSSIADIATAFFYYFVLDDRSQLSTGSAPSVKSDSLIFSVEYNSMTNVGYAICPTYNSGTPFQIELSIFDRNGILVAEENIDFIGYFSEFISQRFPVIQSQSPFIGYVLVESQRNIGLEVLRMDSDPRWFLFTSTPPDNQVH